jgi:hypothetical protein
MKKIILCALLSSASLISFAEVTADENNSADNILQNDQTSVYQDCLMRRKLNVQLFERLKTDTNALVEVNLNLEKELRNCEAMGDCEQSQELKHLLAAVVNQELKYMKLAKAIEELPEKKQLEAIQLKYQQ